MKILTFLVHRQPAILTKQAARHPKQKPIAEHILASFGGEIFLFAASLLLGILTARYLGPDGKGKFNVVYYAVGLLSIIFSLRFQWAFTYYLSKNKERLGEIIFTAFLVGLVSTSAVILLITSFPAFFYSTIIKGVQVQWSTLLLLCASTYMWNLLIALYAGLARFKTRALFMGTTYFLKAALVIFTLKIVNGNLNDLFFNMGLVEIIIYSLLLVVLLAKSSSIRTNLANFVGMLKYSLQSFPSVISDMVILRIDVFFVNFFAGPSQVGLYTVAISLSQMFLYIPTAVRSVLMPYIAANGDQEITQKLSRLLVILLIGMAIILIPFVWVILVPLYGEAFASSRSLYLILLPGSLFWGIFTVISSDLEGRGLPWKVSTVSIISSVITVLLDFLLIPKLGVIGAAIASSVTHCLSMVMIAVVYTRWMHIKMKALLIPGREDFRFLTGFISTVFIKLIKKAI